MVVVFDLDDTLYLEIQFVKSGFWAVATALEPIQPYPVFHEMLALFYSDQRRRVFNCILEKNTYSLSVEDCISLYRFHKPDLHLETDVRETLCYLSQFHSLGLISDGPHQMQRNKFEALGLDAFISDPIFTDELGTSKPDPLPYITIMQRFPEEKKFMYVADNPKKDFKSPHNLGWKTVRIKQKEGIYADIANTAELEINHLFDVVSFV